MATVTMRRLVHMPATPPGLWRRSPQPQPLSWLPSLPQAPPRTIPALARTRPFSPTSQTHSLSFSALSVPEIGVGGMGSEGGGTAGLGGPDAVTLGEAHERGVIGVGLKFNTVSQARKRGLL